jgi:hypothetical protein
VSRLAASGTPRAAGNTRALIALLVLLAFVAVAAGCSPAQATPPPATSPPPSATPAPSRTPPPPPSSEAPSATARPTPPPGTGAVDIPEAGLRLPVPDGWESVAADELADDAVRADLAERYPGAGSLLDAVAAMGDRAVPVYAAFDPAADGSSTPLTTTIAVLVSQPSVGGPLLDLVAGFVGAGLEDAFDAVEASRTRVATPLGEAIRLQHALAPRDGTEVVAVTWLVGAPKGTVLISVLGTEEAVSALDPDALVAAMTSLP